MKMDYKVKDKSGAYPVKNKSGSNIKKQTPGMNTQITKPVNIS